MRRTPMLPTAHLRKLSEQDKHDMTKLKQYGWPTAHIAKEYGVTSSAVNYWLKSVHRLPAQVLLAEAA